jgi:dUTP pyrophosphatase
MSEERYNPLDNLPDAVTDGLGWPSPRDPLRMLRISEHLDRIRLDQTGVLHAVRTDGRPGPAFAPPSYPDDCGLDLALSQDVEVMPGGSVNAPTGVAVALPPGTFGWITGRSSTWSKHGLVVMPGIIDAGWRGELRVMLFRPAPGMYERYESIKLEAGTRLAQLIVLPNLLGDLAVVNLSHGASLSPGTRGEKGFGSSGN